MTSLPVSMSMFARSRQPPPHTHECRLPLALGRAPCLTGTVPTCQVVVGVLVVWVRKEDLGLDWEGARQRSEEVQEEVSEALVLGVWGEEGRSEMATAVGMVEVGGQVQD